MKPILYIVVPCYNEEKVLPITAPLFLEQLMAMQSKNLISIESRIMFVNDGSKDSTWEIIKQLASENQAFIGISQSRNRGHQNAVLAGLMEAKDQCDITISIDCDGQDDISAMTQMVEEYLSGSEVVYGVRSSRKTDTFFKRATAEGFYKFLNIMGAEVVFNHADYRLISARVLKEFANFKEVNLFLRGMIPLVGFKSSSVYYERYERIAGESHYPLSKMLALAIDGITSLSVKPLRLIASLGIAMSVLSIAGLIWAIISKFFGSTTAGWASIVAAICLLSSIQLICIGIIGEYIGKIYLEVKNRPRYIISERTENNEKNNIKEFLLYLVVGGIATVTEWVLFFIMDKCYIHYAIATIIAYLLSTFVNWLAGRLLVFKESYSSFLKEILSIYVASIVGLLLNLVIMWLAVDIANINEMISKILATAIVFFYNFLVRKLLIYKEH